MSDNSNTSSGGIGLFGMTFIVFLVLKLCKVITWSWWYVTAPLWIPLSVLAICLLAFGLFAINKNKN